MRGMGRLVFICLALLLSPAIACLAEGDSDSKLAPTESEALFLDRLMRAESGGRQDARNRASSALGPFQFLEATFLEVVRRNFPALLGKSDAEILALRTDLQVSRDVALIYTRENAHVLAARGKETTAANLRLAFFAGASGALRVLEAKADEPVSNLLSEAAIAANPFLRSMTASQLLARASREAEGLGAAAITTAALPNSSGASKIAVRCNLGLASCRHWLALAEKRLAVRARRVSSVPKQ